MRVSTAYLTAYIYALSDTDRHPWVINGVFLIYRLIIISSSCIYIIM